MKLLGPDGKPVYKTKAAKAVFFVLKKGEWLPVKPKEVPPGLKDKDVMGCLMQGEIIETHEREYYRIEVIH